MWILILWISSASASSMASQGAPTTASFASKQACEAAFAQIQGAFGTDFSPSAPGDYGEPGLRSEHLSTGDTRIWLVKGICVPSS